MPRGVAVSLPTRVPDIRKGDTVVVLQGRDAGKRGTVDRVMRRRKTAYGRGPRLHPEAAPLSDAAVVVDGREECPTDGFFLAPTLLDLMELPQPKEMTGVSLLRAT